MSSKHLPRFSLITLIVAVNVAGVLLWANVRGREAVLQVTDFGAIDEAVCDMYACRFRVHRLSCRSTLQLPCQDDP